MIGAVVAFFWAGVMTITSLDDRRTDSGLPQGSTEASAEAIGYAAGSVMATVLIVAGLCWLLIYFIFLKPGGRRSGPQYFTVLAIAAALGAGPVQLLEIMGAGTRAMNQRIDAALDTYQQTLDTDEQAYTDAVKALGINDRYRVVGAIARDLGGAEQAIAKAREVVARHAALRNTRADETRARLAEAVASDRNRDRMLAEFDAGWAKTKPEMARRWAIENKALDDRQNLIDVLKRSRGRWTTRGSDITFNRQADLDAFNAVMRQMRANNLEEAVFRAEMNRRSAQVRAERAAEKARDGPSRSPPAAASAAPPSASRPAGS